MTSSRSLWTLLLLPALLCWTGCDPDDNPAVTCDYTIPRLLTSDAAECQNFGVRFTQLSTPDDARGPALPVPCGLDPGGDFITRTTILQRPQSSTDPLNFFVYNGTGGVVVAQVFGTEECGMNPRELDCYRSFASVGTFTVFDAAQFEELYLHLTVIQRENLQQPGRNFPYVADGDDYVEVVVKGELPQPTTIPYRVNEDSNDPARRQIALSCDGSSSNRLIFFACDRNTNINDVGRALGLLVDDSKQGRAGTLGALIFPNGADPAKSRQSTETAQEELEENGNGLLGGFVENDRLIRYRGLDLDPGLLDPANQPILNVDEFREALSFRPTSRSSGSGNDVVVSVIDSGTDTKSDPDNYFFGLRYQGTPASCIQPNRFGYDYFNRDATPDDELGHGYSVAGGLISQYSGDRGLAVVHHKIFDGQGRAFYFDALSALLESIEIGSDVINASWGFESQETPAALDCMLGIADQAGIFTATSAGNNATNIDLTFQWPAAFARTYPRTVFSVATYDGGPVSSEYRRASYSNFGQSSVLIAAFVPEVPTLEGRLVYRAGTSFSAPLFARDLLRYLGQGKDPFDPGLGAYPTTTNLATTSRNGNYLAPNFRRGAGAP